MTVVSLHPNAAKPTEAAHGRGIDMENLANVAQTAQIAVWFAFTLYVFAKVF